MFHSPTRMELHNACTNPKSKNPHCSKQIHRTIIAILKTGVPTSVLDRNDIAKKRHCDEGKSYSGKYLNGPGLQFQIFSAFPS